jgi:hypothetical protein
MFVHINTIISTLRSQCFQHNGFQSTGCLKIDPTCSALCKKKQAQRGSALIKTRIRREIPVLHENAQVKPKEASQTHSKPNL